MDNACHLEPTHPAVKIMITEKVKLNNKMILDVGAIIGTFRERIVSRIIDSKNISSEWKARNIGNADRKLNKIRDAVIVFGDHELCLKNLIELIDLSGNDELIKYLKNKEGSAYANFGDDALISKFMTVLSKITRDMDFGTDDINYILAEKFLHLSVVCSSLEKSIQPEPEFIEIHDSTEGNKPDHEAKSMMNESLVNPGDIAEALSRRMREIIVDEIGKNTDMMKFGHIPIYEEKIEGIIDFYYENIATLSLLVISNDSIKNHVEDIAKKASIKLGIGISTQLSDAINDVFGVVDEQLQSRSSLPSM